MALFIFILKNKGSISEKKIDIFLAISVLLILVSVDRMIFINRPTLWEYDNEIGYKHIPNTISNWGPRFEYKTIFLNKYGQHDYDFNIDNLENTYKIVSLGDSTTMGYGVSFNETYPRFLENKLNEDNINYKRYKVINTGVMGYSAFQEFKTMEESMKFKPNLFILGFCANDIVEPYYIKEVYGGTGTEYTGIDKKRSLITNFFLTQTGVGRLVSSFKKVKVYPVEDISLNVSLNYESPYSKKAYSDYKTDFEKILNHAKDNNIPVVVVIFPFSFQIENESLSFPQKILIEDLKKENIPYIDLTEEWKKNKENLNLYFSDQIHYTVKGNEFVANEIYYFLKKNNFSKVNS